MEKTKENVSNNNVVNREGISKQADRMLKRTAQKLSEVTVGVNVTLKIPTVDRTRVDLPNLLGIVMEIKQEHSVFKIGTKSGVLANHYNRQDFAIIKEKFISLEDVPNKVVDLRKAASDASLFGGQGVSMCNCKSVCATKSCGCRKKNVLCNSRCHAKNAGCINK